MPLLFTIVVTNCVRSNHGVSSRVIAPTGMIYTRIDWSQILQHQLLSIRQLHLASVARLLTSLYRLSLRKFLRKDTRGLGSVGVDEVEPDRGKKSWRTLNCQKLHSKVENSRKKSKERFFTENSL